MQSDGHNNDGCDPESRNNVLIEAQQAMIVLLLNSGRHEDRALSEYPGSENSA